MAKSKFGDWSADDLERAAKYMRELDSSSNAKTAFELAKREQVRSIFSSTIRLRNDSDFPLR